MEITETISGYPVKNVKWNPIDNVYTGIVKCPITGREELRDGFVSCCWRRNGVPTQKFGGGNRKDLTLKLE